MEHHLWVSQDAQDCSALGMRRRGEDFTLLQTGVGLPAPETSVLTLTCLFPKPKETLPLLHFRAGNLHHHPWMGTWRKGGSGSRLLVYGTGNGEFREVIAFFHWFMCLLYPTGTFAAPVASPTVTGTQQ